MSAKTRAPRQTKTPRQRAQEQLGVAERAVARLTDKAEDLRAELEDVQIDLEQATRRRDYLAGHPDLGDPQQLTIDDAEATS